jgi:hypothetical protein
VGPPRDGVESSGTPGSVVDGHRSRTAVAGGLERPTRRSERRGPRRRVLRPFPAYMALLQVGLAVPGPSPAPRWALTPPFHPCLIPSTRPGEPGRAQGHRRFALCCAVPGLAPGGRYPPPCPGEPGRSSKLALRGRLDDSAATVSHPLRLGRSARREGPLRAGLPARGEPSDTSRPRGHGGRGLRRRRRRQARAAPHVPSASLRAPRWPALAQQATYHSREARWSCGIRRLEGPPCACCPWSSS